MSKNNSSTNNSSNNNSSNNSNSYDNTLSNSSSNSSSNSNSNLSIDSDNTNNANIQHLKNKINKLLDLYDSEDLQEDDEKKEKVYKKLQKYKRRLKGHVNKYSLLPNAYSKPFVNNLFSKEEFAINENKNSDMQLKYKYKLDEDFILSQNQIFIKKFISPNTPYKSILLYHSTGTGKTCSSAHIIENYKNYYDKPALILLQPTIQENYKRELFDIKKYKIENDNMKQCLGNEYLHQIVNRKKMDLKEIEKAATKLIDRNYQFMGYGQLGILVDKLQAKYKGINKQFVQAIQKQFSDRVIVIDEVHNMKISNEKDKKSAIALYDIILKYAKNTVLILLSATPIYDKPKEILWIMNTLLLNDKKKIINDKITLFDDNNVLTPKFKNMLQKFSNSYVSYMRGENYNSFPIKLYPFDNKYYLSKDEHPKYDLYKKKIEPIKHMILHKTFMSDMQVDIYNDNLALANLGPDDFNSDSDVEEQDEEDITKKITKSVEQQKSTKQSNKTKQIKKNYIFDLTQISNVIFPSDVPKFNFGNAGFNNIFEHANTDGKLKLSYKTKKFIFDQSNLKLYSPKIDKIVQYIEKSTGIIFVYSRFLNSGIMPLAIALEHLGYNKYNNEDLLSKKQNKAKSNKKNYMIISGTTNISGNLKKEIEIIRSSANKDGNLIKIILSTTKGIEGIDYKNIREIHILEPWFNLSRIDQIIGRGIRNNSHIDLPEELRNTTIYHYANLIKKNETETVDYRMYRKAERKQLQISQIERVMKESSIDCNLNKNILILKKIKKTLVNSQGQQMIDYHVGDQNYSKECDYQECGITCKPTVDLSTNKSIKDLSFIKYETKIVKKIIKNYFNNINDDSFKKYSFTFEDLKNYITNYDVEILYNALYELETSKEIFKVNDLEGYLIFRSKYYIFQPLIVDNTKISIEDRNVKKRNIPDKIYLPNKNTDNIQNTITNTAETDKILNKFYTEVHEIKTSLIYLPNIDITIVYNMYLDRLSYTDRVIILQEIAKDNNSSIKDKNTILNALKKNKIYIIQDEKLVAFYDIFNQQFSQFNYENNTFVKCATSANEKYKDKFLKYMAKLIEDKKTKNNFYLYGYSSINYKTLILQTKIFDIINPTPKATGTFIKTSNPFTKDKLIQLINNEPFAINIKKIEQVFINDNKDKKKNCSNTKTSLM